MNPNPARKKAVSCFKSYSPKSHENCFTTENYLLWEENSNSKQKNPFLQVLNSHTTKHIYRTWKRALLWWFTETRLGGHKTHWAGVTCPYMG